MVLHNDKWKYKARRNYMRKHGLKTLERDKDKRKAEKETKEKDNHASESVTKNETETDKDSADEENTVKQKETEKTSDKEEENTSNDISDNEEEVKKKKLGSNSWRFHGDMQDEIELMKDPELIEAEKQRREEEQQIFDQQKDIVIHHLMEVGDNDSTFKNVIKKEDHMGKRDNDKEFLEALMKAFGDGRKQQDEETKYSSNDKMTPEERQQFFKLQKEIKHQKMVQNARGGYSPKKASGKGKSLELNLSSDANKYRDIVAQRLEEGKRKINLEGENFEDDLKELIGDSSETRNKKNQTKNSAVTKNTGTMFDLDKLIYGNNKKAAKIDTDIVESNIKMVKQSPSNISKEDEKFLDDILGI